MNEMYLVNKCVMCNDSLEYSDEFESHVLSSHSMSYSKYYEYYKSIGFIKCDNCGSTIYRVSPWYDIKCPCEKCNNQKDYYEMILLKIKEIYSVLCSNDIIRIFILSRELRERLTEFDLLEVSHKIGELGKNFTDKINLFNISFIPGRSPYIKSYDLSNIVLEKSKFNILPSEISQYENNEYKINIGNNQFSIRLPEECEYHNNNHYKYNILNRANNPQSAKKLLLSSGKCIKFYNTNIDRCKSIIRVSKNGNEVYSLSLTNEEIEYIKYYIMCNFSLLRSILDILYELIKNSDTIYDYCFLLNKVLVNKSGKFNMIIDWTINNRMLSSDKDSLNISIL